MLGNAGMWDNMAKRGASVVSQPQVPCIVVWEANVGGSGSMGFVQQREMPVEAQELLPSWAELT